jgi:hypothetical protein
VATDDPISVSSWTFEPIKAAQPRAALNAFAQKVETEMPLVEGACSPRDVPPYMHLDSHCWEEMRRQIPRSGPNAVPPIALSARYWRSGSA